MAFAARFLHPIRKSIAVLPSSSPSISPSRRSFCGKSGYVKTWWKEFEPVLHKSGFRLQFFGFTGSKLYIGSIFGVSVLFGTTTFSRHVAYAMDGHDVLVDDHHAELMDSSDVEDESRALWMFLRKIWMPVFFFFTVFVNWDHPITLVTKVTLLLLGTKPSPFSVYVFVEQLCDRSMRQEPHLYKVKALYANKVEVQDYRLFCLASVEVRNKKFNLVGILGNWWVLPSSPYEGALSVLRIRAIQHLRDTSLRALE